MRNRPPVLCVAVLSFLEDNLSDGVLCGVRDGDVRGVCAGLMKESMRLSVKVKDGRARVGVDYFDVMPCEAAAPTRAQSFEGGFLGGKARGVVLRGDCFNAPFAVGTLALCEHARGKARRAAQDFVDARDFDNIYADGNNHRRRFETEARRILLAREPRAQKRARALLLAARTGRLHERLFNAHGRRQSLPASGA